MVTHVFPVSAKGVAVQAGESSETPVQLTWLIRVMRLIRWTIDPPINHEARINHVNKARPPGPRAVTMLTVLM
jgi:hypothetical protein